MIPETSSTASGSEDLATRYTTVRRTTEQLCSSLSPEDCVVQSMPDVSPAKWHLAHVTWFFETFLLKPHLEGYRPQHPEFEYLFNSYYNSVGEQYPRPDRGLLTRPSLEQVFEYRHRIDRAMDRLLERDAEEHFELIRLGLNHEEQHQELLLMDIKHVLSRNPLFPAYAAEPDPPDGSEAAGLAWLHFDEGLHRIGHEGNGFCFDNERPPHRRFLQEFEIASRLVTNGEFLQFMNDGGYREPRHWLADGWTQVRSESWQAPLYWVRREDRWSEYTLRGLRALDLQAPVGHVSYYEADAYANWAGARLPEEAEWERAAEGLPQQGNFLEQAALIPLPPAPGGNREMPLQMFGDLWEWTRSAYSPYPGFRATAGAIGEYNGKFMCNQFVLRGGACITSRSHIRPTYRNFFYPHCRWQFGGIRLARDPGSAEGR